MSSPHFLNLPLLRTRTMSSSSTEIQTRTSSVCSTEIRTRTASVCSTESILADISSHSLDSNTFAPASKKLWYRKGYKPNGIDIYQTSSVDSLDNKEAHKWANSPSDEKRISRLLHIRTNNSIVETEIDTNTKDKNTFHTSSHRLPELHD